MRTPSLHDLLDFIFNNVPRGKLTKVTKYPPSAEKILAGKEAMSCLGAHTYFFFAGKSLFSSHFMVTQPDASNKIMLAVCQGILRNYQWRGINVVYAMDFPQEVGLLVGEGYEGRVYKTLFVPSPR